MSRRRLFFVSAAGALAAVALFPASGQAPAGFAVQGSVVAAENCGQTPALTLTPLESPGPAAHQLAAFERWRDGGAVEAIARTEADGEGRFQLRAPGRGLFAVRAEAPGCTPMERWVGPEGDRMLEPVLLEAALRLDIRVTEEGGAPIPGSRVVAAEVLAGWLQLNQAWYTPDRVGSTDAQGRVAFDLRAGADAIDLRVTAPGFAARRLRVDPLEAARSLDVRLARGRLVEVRVFDGNKKAAAGVAIVDSLHLPLAVTDGNGLARVGIDGNQRLLGAFDAAGWSARGEVPAQGPLTLTLQPPTEFRGRVFARNGGGGVADAWIWRAGAFPGVVRSGRDGTFRLPVLPIAPDWLAAVADGYGLEAQADASRHREQVALALDAVTVVAGEVVDGDGKVVAGADLTLAASRQSYPPRGGLPRPRQVQIARSDARGRFRLESVPVGQPLVLLAQKSPFLPAALELPPLAAGAPREDLRLALDEAATAVGEVLDGNGRPIAGAEVALQPAGAGNRSGARWPRNTRLPSTLTGEAGHFRVRGVAPGLYDLMVRASGFAAAEIPGLEVAATGEQDLGQVVMAPGVALTGSVRNAAGEALAGAQIAHGQGDLPAFGSPRRPAPFATTAVAGADGSFTVPDLKPGRNYHVTVRFAGYAQRQIPGITLPLDRDLAITLEPGAALAGQVVDPGGNPLPRADVALLVGGGPRPAQTTRSDEGGRFRFDDLEAGSYGLQAGAEGFVERQLLQLELVAGERREDVRLELRAGARVDGVVEDALGEPVEGVRIGVSQPGRGPRARQATTDAAGRFRIEGLAPGIAELRADHPTQPQRLVESLDLEDGASRSLELRFAAGVRLAGIVRSVGEPAALIAVELEETEKRGADRQVFSDAEGLFAFEGVRPGRYQLSARGADGSSSRLAATIEVGTEPISGLELTLEPGVRLRGVVRGLELEDLRKLFIVANRRAGAGLVPRDRARFSQPDFAGTFELQGLSPGTWQIRATVRDGDSSVAATVDLAEGQQEAEVELDFSGAGKEGGLAGEIRLDGQVLAGARVQLTDSARLLATQASTDQQGRYQFSLLPAGSYQVNVWMDGGIHTMRQVEVGSTIATLDIELVSLALRGRVIDAASREGLEGAMVIVDTGYHFGRTDATGLFDLGRVSADGAANLSVVLPGYRTSRQPIELSERGLGALLIALDREP